MTTQQKRQLKSVIREELENILSEETVSSRRSLTEDSDSKYANKAIKELESWQKKYYKLLGDDEVWDSIDREITRILDWAKENLD